MNARDLLDGCRGVILMSVRNGKPAERLRFVAISETATVILHTDGGTTQGDEFQLREDFTDVLEEIDARLKKIN